MSVKRRNFLIFLGASLGTTALAAIPHSNQRLAMPFARPAQAFARNGLSFKPVQTPMPLAIEGLSAAKQQQQYSSYEVKDDLVLPEGFTYDVIAAWGDRVGDSRFGYNNDYLSFVETAPNEGYLTVNFEYISGYTWMQTYTKVIGQTLPFDAVKAIASESGGKINAFALADDDPLKAQIQAIAKEGLIDQGIGVISIRRQADGRWQRTYSAADRRITGISGLDDGRYLKTTGPAIAVFRKTNKRGYEDNLGDRIIGTFQNCAGGTTPWGTVFSAEENVQDQIPEPVMADGSSLDPAQQPFILDDELVDGRANAFGLAGNKYGWMVEVDPANANDYGTKHTWLGRYRHEAVGIRAVSGQKLAMYSGCDRRGGHLYKFVSNGTVRNPKDKANSRLLEDGMLYGAKFNADGTGEWIPLTLTTPVSPVLPSSVDGKMVPLPNPNRREGGIVKYTDDADAIAYQQQFKTLADLYEGTEIEKQGAILIDAHFAANAAGITCTARPEDTIVDADGTLYIAFTSGTPGGDGGPDKAVFTGPDGQSSYEYGWIVRLQENNDDAAAIAFRWDKLAVGGEPVEGGLGFSNPDNIEIDQDGHLWMVTDMSTSSHNQEVLSRTKEGKPIGQKELLGLFGNNSIWFIPTSGEAVGQAYPFGIGPMEAEICGPYLTRDQTTMFVAVQHPGERNGTRQAMATEVRTYAMRSTDGQGFMQERKVPIGSNWPGRTANDPPKPAVVAIRSL
jgi:secreted PhoX family phosphatase